MSIEIDQTALKALTATLQKLQAAVNELARLDAIEIAEWPPFLDQRFATRGRTTTFRSD